MKWKFKWITLKILKTSLLACSGLNRKIWIIWLKWTNLQFYYVIKCNNISTWAYSKYRTVTLLKHISKLLVFLQIDVKNSQTRNWNFYFFWLIPGSHRMRRVDLRNQTRNRHRVFAAEADDIEWSFFVGAISRKSIEVRQKTIDCFDQFHSLIYNHPSLPLWGDGESTGEERLFRLGQSKQQQQQNVSCQKHLCHNFFQDNRFDGNRSLLRNAIARNTCSSACQ